MDEYLRQAIIFLKQGDEAANTCALISIAKSLARLASAQEQQAETLRRTSNAERKARRESQTPYGENIGR